LISIGKVIRSGDAGASRYGLLPQEHKAVATGRRTSQLPMIIGHDYSFIMLNAVYIYVSGIKYI
jgi:hypothetical protein